MAHYDQAIGSVVTNARCHPRTARDHQTYDAPGEDAVNRRTWAALAGMPLLLAACGTNTASAPEAASHTMSDGSTMSGSMSGMHMTGKVDPKLAIKAGTRRSPSASARMICSGEIRQAIRNKLELSHLATGMHVWGDTIFSCSYRLPAGGDLRLSVKDLDAAGPGRAYFEQLRSRTPGARTIKGLAAFGFPAFESARGDTVFLKDHKTLWVDASRLTGADLPPGTSRQDASYGIAAAVIACWTE